MSGWSGRSGGVLVGREARVEVQAVAGEQLELESPEGDCPFVGVLCGVAGGLPEWLLVEGRPDSRAGTGEGVAVEERGEVHVAGEDSGLGVVRVVEDVVWGFGRVVGRADLGVLAEPGGGVEDGAEGELVGVRSEDRRVQGGLGVVDGCDGSGRVVRGAGLGTALGSLGRSGDRGGEVAGAGGVRGAESGSIPGCGAEGRVRGGWSLIRACGTVLRGACSQEGQEGASGGFRGVRGGRGAVSRCGFSH